MTMYVYLLFLLLTDWALFLNSKLKRCASAPENMSDDEHEDQDESSEAYTGVLQGRK
jgi:hypothetical protein